MDKIVGFDLATPNAEGTDNVTLYLLDLINSYPLLDGEEIRFQSIKSGTMTMVPTSNVAILSEKKSITGHVTQKCQYAFQIYKTAKGLSENNQIRYKEFLDNLGLWLQGLDYPAMADGMKMDSIKPANTSALYVRDDNQSEAWMIPINAVYIREFERN